MGYGVEEPEDPSDPNFNEAIRHIEATKIHWVAQLELVLRHPVQLWLDVHSLHGVYSMVRPFVHQAISGTLQAVSALAFDPQWRDKITPVTVVHVTRCPPGKETSATLKNGILTVSFKLRQEDFMATHEARVAILEALGHTPGLPVERTRTEDMELAAFEAHEAGQASPASPAADPYQQADAHMKKLEQVLKEQNLWPGEKPHGEIEVRGAFGCENMPFQHWLAWILIERVRAIIRERGDFPAQSQVSTYARREFDGMPGGDDVVAVLIQFDDFINALSRQ